MCSGRWQDFPAGCVPRLGLGSKARRSFRKLAHTGTDADQRVGGLPPGKKCMDQGDARWSRPARPAKRSAKLARGLSDSRRLFGTALTETPAGLDGNMIASR
jgi:hypothetical protein